MRKENPFDGGKVVDWSKTSADYGRYRPGPPLSFYTKLQAHDIGMQGQKILDIGTGTGLLARQFARQGAVVSGIDVAEGQIAMANTLADEEDLHIDFRVSPAEQLPFPDDTFDVVSACQCWFYFNTEYVIPEVRRVLVPGGVLVTAHFSWLPRIDAVAGAMERMVKQFNPAWSSDDWSGEIPAFPEWAHEHFRLKGMFFYDEEIPFTHESWRGRIRACRGVGAALDKDQTRAFDEAHRLFLDAEVPDPFAVLHRIDAHILEVRY